VELRIVDPGSGDPVVPGEPGEFWVRAAQNTTSEWLATGDTGWQDEEGYLFLTGRLSDVINRGGEKLGPIEVEDVLRSHPAVSDAGVVGVPDTEFGERVGAVVVVTDTVSREELTAHCASRLASFKVPEYVGFADELPVTVLGKLDRRSLLDLLPGARSGARPPA
jgi:long-chain acyl-CoA synthetase